MSAPSRYQRGNILFLILLAVVLFAALAYAVTSSMRGGGRDAGSETVQLQSAQITQYATSLEQSLARMRLMNNCRDDQISFENGVVTGYTFTTPNACKLFHSDGGGMTWQDPPKAAGTEPYLFNGNSRILWMGTDSPNTAGEAAELALYLPIKSRALCEQLNASLGNPAARAIDHASGTAPSKFTGTYYPGNIIPDDGGNMTGYSGKAAACVDVRMDRYPGTSGYEYLYYHVLLAR